MRLRGRIPARSNKWLVRVASAFFILVAGGIVFFIAAFAYFAGELPSPDKVLRREGFSTKIFDRNGKLLYDVFSDQRRTPVDLQEVPLYLRQATIAIEDKNFYKHSGVDPLTPVRIAWNLVVKRRVVGGSSLTQQLVKNVLLTPERTPIRKLKEFVLTLQVESRYKKDDILQMYLNEVPYGGTSWGVETASEVYFGKPVSEVSLAEAVILAGLPQSPTYYSPFDGTRYVGRAEEVLRRMREDGYITVDEENKTKEELPRVAISTQSGLLKAPHFVFYVKQELLDRYDENIVEQGGLRVTTSLDLDLQEATQKAVTEEIEKVKHLKISNGAAVVLNPKNGQILAMVGSRGWEDPDYDGKYNVVTAMRQPGSAIKPVAYLTALRKGYTASTLLMDTKTVFPGGDRKDYIPENYDGKFRGPVLMRDALGNSLNIPAVKMVALVGIREMLQTGYDIGFTTLNPTPELLKRVGLSVALGGGEVKLLDMASAYSSFANGGIGVKPVAILKVTDSEGKVLEEWKEDQSARQVMTPEESFIISSILSDPEARMITFGPVSSLNIPNRKVAVKTGTTNDKRDNWTVGWTPSLMVGVWVGNNDNSAMREVASGVTGASPIWKRIMLAGLTGKPNEEWKKPDGIIERDVDKVSGYPGHDGFPARMEYFINGTEPTGEDPIHKKIKVCKGEGKLATPADVASGNYDEKEAFYFKEEDPYEAANGGNKWQEGILNWLKDQADPKYHPPTDFCGTTNPLWISIQEPGNQSRVNSNDVKIRTDVTSPGKVNKVEFYVDGNLRETLTNSPWELTVNLADGKHKVDIKAWDDQGHDGSRFVEFMVNQDWQ